MVRKSSNILIILLVVVVSILSACQSKSVPTVSNDPIEQKQDSSQTEPIPNKEQESEDQKKEIQEKQKVAYISASKLKVREEAKVDSKAIDNLPKGSEVKIIEEVTDENNKIWYKIEPKGYIVSEYTVADRTELLTEELRKLDFLPQQKTYEYENNKRVKAKGVYVTIHSAANSRLDKLIELTKETKLNAFVIDVKDDNGYMLFKTNTAEKFCPEANNKATIKDISELMKKLKDNNIYTIARIVSFKDPTYAKHYPDKTIIDKNTGKPHTNKDGLIWVSPYDRTLWEYNIEVAKEAIDAGFNEIQFDYVRFPASDGGKLDKILDYKNTTGENKPQVIQNYLKYARQELSKKEAYISADIYGLVGSVQDDMSLGQYWEAVSNIVDYVCPMMYPSHYANGTYGLSIPDAYPYETILNSAKDSAARNKNIETPGTIRPWIQDFTATWVKGHIRYGVDEVKAQIKALEENGIDEYLLWNAGNGYTKEAVIE